MKVDYDTVVKQFNVIFGRSEWAAVTGCGYERETLVSRARDYWSA